MCAAHACSIKSRRNKKLIAEFVSKLRDESNEPNYVIIRNYIATVTHALMTV